MNILDRTIDETLANLQIIKKAVSSDKKDREKKENEIRDRVKSLYIKEIAIIKQALRELKDKDTCSTREIKALKIDLRTARKDNDILIVQNNYLEQKVAETSSMEQEVAQYLQNMESEVTDGKKS